MRVTIEIDDELHAHAKRKAAERGITLGAYVQERLRATLDRLAADATGRTSTGRRDLRGRGPRRSES